MDSAGGAFLTLQKAVASIQALDRSTYDVSVTIGAGTFTGAASFAGVGPGTGNIYFAGAGATTIISTTNANCFTATKGAEFTVSQMKLQTTTGGNCLGATGGSITVGAGIEFGSCAGTAHCYVDGNGKIALTANYTISGNAGYAHLFCDNGLIYPGSSLTVTASGTRAFSTFIVSTYTGVMISITNTYSGTFTGKRYEISLNGAVQTYGGGANYFPGNAAGTTATGGQYA